MILEKKIQKVCALLEEQEELAMSEKVKKKNEIIIINRFKENSADSIITTLIKVFEMFCNMQITNK